MTNIGLPMINRFPGETVQSFKRLAAKRGRLSCYAVWGSILLCWFVSPNELTAQLLRAQIVDSVTSQPISGVVVSVLDNKDQPLLRTVANEQGRFALVIPPTASHLRIQRIGYRARIVGRAFIDFSSMTTSFRMERLATLLQPMRIASAASACEMRSDRQEAMGLLIQVRDGLLAATVAGNSEFSGDLPKMKIARYDQLIDRRTSKRYRRTVLVDSLSSNTRLFKIARSADELIADGFARDSAGQSLFYGLDAEVLLSDAFIAGYCFHLVSQNSEHRNQIGLGFEAEHRTSGVISIAGTVWVDTVARALHSLEYDYVGVPSVERFVRPGGRITYRTMANGSVMVDRWLIRLAAAKLESVRGQLRFVGYDIHETGGELLRVRWVDGTEWKAELARVTLKIRDQLNRAVSGVSVALDSTSYRGVSNSEGTVEIEDILPGFYRIFLLDPLATIPVAGSPAIPVPDAVLDVTKPLPYNVTLLYQPPSRDPIGRSMNVRHQR